MIDLATIRDELKHLSGSGKRVVSTRRHGLYSTITLPGLDDMPAVRDTSIRFSDFGIPADLSGKTFLDLGSNVGAMAFEAARRGAKVSGVEFRSDRVALCNLISKYFDLDAKFYQADFNTGDGCKAVEWCHPHDIVLCCSVTEYIEDLETFYDMMSDLCSGTIYFEDNIQRGFSVDDTLAILERHGFKNIVFLGSGHSGGISRKRKIYRAEQGR